MISFNCLRCNFSNSFFKCVCSRDNIFIICDFIYWLTSFKGFAINICSFLFYSLRKLSLCGIAAINTIYWFTSLDWLNGIFSSFNIMRFPYLKETCLQVIIVISIFNKFGTFFHFDLTSCGINCADKTRTISIFFKMFCRYSNFSVLTHY